MSQENGIVCNCGHYRSEHVEFGPCTVSTYQTNAPIRCTCDGYSQTKLNKEYGKDIRNRVILETKA